MTSITIPVELELTVRPSAVMDALSRALSPQFVARAEPAEQATQAASDRGAQALSAPVAPGAYWPEHDAWYAGLQMTPGGRFWHVLVPKAHIDALKDVKWGEYGTLIEGAADVFDGLANTQAMAAAGLDLAKRVQTLAEDLYLPSRSEALLVFTTLKDQIDGGVIWTSTQYSAHGAWYQNFSNGIQYLNLKVCELRAVPVRRLFL